MLTVDVGNTSIGIGRWSGDEVTVERCRTPDEAAERLVEPAVVIAVAPARLEQLMAASEGLGRPAPTILVGTPVACADPRLAETAGADRLAAAAALAPGPAVAIDAGTAVTVDAVGADGRFLGGFIAPGLAASIDGLARAAPALPPIVGRPVDLALGTETLGAMEAGAFWLLVGGVDRLVEAACAHLGSNDPVRLVATGGWGGAWAAASRHAGIEHDPHLVHRGIRLWAERRR